jgi:hypothetical protein
MIRSLTVITDETGEVIGAQIGQGAPDPTTGAVTTVVAGPGQTLHTIDYDVPRLDTPEDIENFHRKLTELLRK